MKELLKDLRDNKILVELVDGELKVFAEQADVNPLLIGRIRENKHELIDFLKNNRLLETDHVAGKRIPVAGQRPCYPVSWSQYRLWVLAQFPEANIAYNVTGVYVFSGAFNPVAFSASLDAVVQRHESLRTAFRETTAGVVSQFVLSAEESGFRLVMLDMRGENDLNGKIASCIHSLAAEAFDLSAGCLLRASLIHTGEKEWHFVYTMHHIISDGWSMGILMREVLMLYNSFSSGGGNPLAPLRIQYKDYAVWLQEALGSESLKEHKNFWMDVFKGELPVLAFPTDKDRPAIRNYEGSVVRYVIGRDAAVNFRQLCNARGCTSFMSMMALVTALLYRYTGQEDIIIGTPVAGRDHLDLEDQIGFYANTLALRIQFREEDSFIDLLDNVRAVTIKAYEHQVYPFDKLIEDLGLKRDMSRNPLFDVQVIVQSPDNERKDRLHHPQQGMQIREYNGTEKVTSVFDMVFNFIESADGFELSISHSTLYSRDLITSLANNLDALLRAVAQQPDIPLSRINFLHPADRRRLLEEFNPDRAAYDVNTTLAGLFADQVKATPDAVALVFEGVRHTYAQADARASKIAHYLLTTCGIKPDQIVGVMTGRSDLMIIAILAVLKAGGAYLPIDAGHPSSRKAWMLQDTGAGVLLTTTELMFDIDDYEGMVFAVDVQTDLLPEPDMPLGLRAGPEQLAYVIYTSGSTGQPKGVMINHCSIVNTILNQRRIFEVQPGERHLQFSSISFDAAVSEIFVALTSGAALYIVPDHIKADPELLGEMITACQPDLATIPPAYLATLREEQLLELKRLVSAGDMALKEKVAGFVKHGICYNAYGPTECSICATVYRMDHYTDMPAGAVPVGRAMPHTRIYIVDRHLNLLPPGAIGEICIGGRNVGKGYLNQDTLTAEKFLEDPFVPGERIYRTGDYGRWLPDGNLVFTGRRDDQVKLHGYRIELGEIERTLLECPGVAQAAVLIRQDGQAAGELIAFVQVAEGVTVDRLRSHLLGRLPAYMAPSHYVCVDNFPVTVNGKLDKRLLLAQSLPELSTNEEYVGARNRAELALLSTCEEVLRRSGISMHDDFFVLGGDSIKSIQVVSRLKQHGYSLTIQDVMHYSRLEDLAGKMRNAVHVADQGLISGKVALSPIQHYFFSLSGSGRHHYNQSVLLVNRERVAPEGVRLVLQRLTEQHDALRMVFREEEGVWLQENLREVHGSLLEVVAAADEVVYRKGCDAFQAGMELETGPLFRACLFRMEQEDRLLLVAHHLVVDGVSWRIILEDLASLFGQYNAGQQFILPQKSDAFLYWMECQLAYAQSDELTAEAAYWSALEAAVVAALPVDHVSAVNTMEDIRNEACLLDEATTALLQTACYDLYGTDINDVLVAALCMSLRSVFNRRETILGMEGHGREDIGAVVDVTRTVGWFTTSYPVLLQLGPEEDIIRDLLDVKETLHRVPNKGLGYGVLRYLRRAGYQVRPEITFNYLGDFGKGGGLGEMENNTWRLSGGYRGKEHAGGLERPSLLDVAGMIVGGRLSLSVSYSFRQYEAATIQRLVIALEGYVRQLVTSLSADANLAELSYNQLLYFSEWKPENEVMVSDFTFANLDTVALETAVNNLVSRHEVLRTRFVTLNGRIVQQIAAPADVCCKLRPPEEVVSTAEMEQRFSATAPLFSPGNLPLFDIRIFYLTGQYYVVRLSVHHSIFDGYSQGVLIKDLERAYRAVLTGIMDNTPPLAFQYRDFARWQRKYLYTKEGQADKRYWLEKLASADRELQWPRLHPQGRAPEERANAVSALFTVQDAFFEDMKAVSQEKGFTKSLIAMGALAVLLARLRNCDDVIITTLVSGRNSSQFGNLDVSDLIGYFSSMILVRCRIDATASLLETMKDIRDGFLHDLDHAAYPLVRLLKELPLPLPADAIDRIAVYNYHNYEYLKAVDYNTGELLSSPRFRFKKPVKETMSLMITEYRNCLTMEMVLDGNYFNIDAARHVTDVYLDILRHIVYSSYMLVESAAADHTDFQQQRSH